MMPMTATTVAKIGAGTASVVVTVHCVPLLAAMAGLVAAVILAVALPAIWSAKPARRAAALNVLKVIFPAAHPSRQGQQPRSRSGSHQHGQR